MKSFGTAHTSDFFSMRFQSRNLKLFTSNGIIVFNGKSNCYLTSEQLMIVYHMFFIVYVSISSAPLSGAV